MLEKVQSDRLAKLQKIRQLGIDPYGSRYDTAEAIDGILKRYKDDDDAQVADAAGRLVLIRDMGKMIFAHIRDESGQMQIALRKDALDEISWKLTKLLDLGDIIDVAGPLKRTKTGEITIWAQRLTLLTKSLNPMPEKFHGLVDVETRYRKRYLDLMTNPDSLANFKKRVAIIEHFRSLLKARGFVEVETPMMQSIYGGAAARPFVTHHNALDIDLYMRISPELYLKRLLVGGMQKVFEINRNFRNEGLDTQHNPEFTMLELYQAYADYDVMMDLTEEIICLLVAKFCPGNKIEFGNMKVDFSRPWRRVQYAQLIKEHTGCEIDDIGALRKKAAQLDIDEAGMDDVIVIDALFKAAVEDKLVDPTFVIDYPAALCPLTRRKKEDPKYAERFELYIAQMELANAYTELNDPAQQYENFLIQLRGQEDSMARMDNDFINALKYGMPPAGGLGIGIDRLVMVMTGALSIRDVILFPLLRPVPEPPVKTGG